MLKRNKTKLFKCASVCNREFSLFGETHKKFKMTYNMKLKLAEDVWIFANVQRNYFELAFDEHMDKGCEETVISYCSRIEGWA